MMRVNHLTISEIRVQSLARGRGRVPLVTTLSDAARATGLRYESANSGRWVRLWGPADRALYIAEYTWSEDCLKHYVLFRGPTSDDEVCPAVKCTSMAEAFQVARDELLVRDLAYADVIRRVPAPAAAVHALSAGRR